MHAEENNGRTDIPIDRVKIRRFKKLIRNAILKGQTRIEGLSVPLEIENIFPS